MWRRLSEERGFFRTNQVICNDTASTKQRNEKDILLLETDYPEVSPRNMQLFGRKSKIEFTADRPPREILENPRGYSYVHNFKVHFKTSRIQMIATKMDISISSEDPETPTNQLVTSQFNQQMMMILNNPNLRTSKDKFPSYHITMIEYKESIAMPTGKARRADTDSTQSEKFTICSSCENKLPSGSSFCNKCGQPVE